MAWYYFFKIVVFFVLKTITKKHNLTNLFFGLVFSIISISYIFSSPLTKESPTNWMSMFILILIGMLIIIFYLPCTFSIILASELDKIKRKVWWANYLLLYENCWFFFEANIQYNICSTTVWTMLDVMTWTIVN